MSAVPQLPNFTNPPVIEVFLSMQFEPLPELKEAHLGRFWKSVERELPCTEQHPPLDQQIERFGGKPTAQGGFGLRIQIAQARAMRMWFISRDGGELLQVQNDRLIRNWRKVDQQPLYPRYGAVRRKFRNNYTKFAKFLETRRLGTIVPNQCEVGYVNHIVAGAGWETHADMIKVFCNLQDGPNRDSLPPLENQSLEWRYVLSDLEGHRIGRLFVTATPAFRIADDAPMFAFQLIARGQPLGEGLPGVLKFMDLGRAAIVNAFAALTTDEMHGIWGRTKNVNR